MQHIVFLDRDSIVADIRRPACAHTWTEYGNSASAEVVTRAQAATVIITNKVALSASTLARLPHLRLIAVCATGTDPIDLDYCRSHAIAVSNIRDYALYTVPEHVLMLMLALRRNLFAYRDALDAGAWQQAQQFCLFGAPIHDLHGSTLGIVGYGALGRAVARLAQAFGMQVRVAEHKGATTLRAGYLPWDEVLRTADVISLHTPLTPQTRALIGAAELASMKPSALLINCGRGGLIDEAALLAALQAGTIAGAATDVLSNEPPRAGNVLLNAGLPNLIITPHIAWASREAMQAMAAQLIDNIEAFVDGRQQNRVV